MYRWVRAVRPDFAHSLQPVRDEVDLSFASRDLARARAYAALFQGRGAFGSNAAAAADPRVEALYLCTPHHLHQAHVALAAQAGKHILVEKPSPAPWLKAAR